MLRLLPFLSPLSPLSLLSSLPPSSPYPISYYFSSLSASRTHILSSSSSHSRFYSRDSIIERAQLDIAEIEREKRERELTRPEMSERERNIEETRQTEWLIRIITRGQNFSLENYSKLRLLRSLYPHSHSRRLNGRVREMGVGGARYP